MFDSFKSKYSLTFAQLGQKLGATPNNLENEAKAAAEVGRAGSPKTRSSRQEGNSPKNNNNGGGVPTDGGSKAITISAANHLKNGDIS